MREARDLLEIDVVGKPHALEMDVQHLGARGLVGQRHVDPPLEPTAHRLVQVPRLVGGREHHHEVVGAAASAARANPVHLHKQLRLETPRRLVLTSGTPT